MEASKEAITGNLRQVLDKNGWGFLKSLESYDGIVKLHGPLGVCTPPTAPQETTIDLCVRQHRMLYVFDPTAMHNIIVKDQYIYEEAAFFIK